MVDISREEKVAQQIIEILQALDKGNRRLVMNEVYNYFCSSCYGENGAVTDLCPDCRIKSEWW